MVAVISAQSRADALAGCLLGIAVGDALGLPYEGLSARRGRRLYGTPSRCRLVFGRGMISDDTEHACMTAQSIIVAGDNEARFQRDLARRLRWWLLGMPAGCGLATLRGCLRLWRGIPPERSGVNSAGNGPAMRSAILGAAMESVDSLTKFNRISARMTHTDPRAESGALAIGLAARAARRSDTINPVEFRESVHEHLSDSRLRRRIDLAIESAGRGESTAEFIAQLDMTRGITGFIENTVPAVLQTWLRRSHDFPAAVTEIIECGGDTDSTAALVGGLVGTATGVRGIPEDWLAQMIDWPRSAAWIAELGRQLDLAAEEGAARTPPKLPILPLLARNIGFAAIVLTHGFYRLRPW